MQTAPKTEARPWWRRPRVRMSLRALMLMVLVLGGWLGWMVRGARIQREAVAAIQRGGGSVRYDWEWATFRYLPDGRLVQPMPKPGTKPPWPQWLVTRLGPDYLGSIKEVVVGPTDPDLVMARVAGLGRVESLRIARESAITDAGLRHIRGLTSLESFSIGTPVSDRITTAWLDGFAGLTRLRRLFLANRPPLTDADLVHLRNLTALQELYLPVGRGGGITDAGLANLAGLTDLRYLVLSGHPGITSVGLAHLRGMTRLVELMAALTRIDDLSPIAGLTRLSLLQLSGTPITDAGLAPVAGLTGLQHLFLRDTRITGAGLAHLRGLSNLTTLDLFMTRVSDAGMTHLAGLKALQTLTLASTQVTDAGLVHLAGSEAMQTLSLYDTQVTDAGLVHLGRLSSLTRLNLGKTQVTDAGLAHLAGLKALKSLTIAGSRVTDAGIAAFRAAAPGVQIVQPNPMFLHR